MRAGDKHAGRDVRTRTAPRPTFNSRRLRSLDEFQSLPWHVRRPSRLLTVPMILALAAALAVGALLGLTL